VHESAILLMSMKDEGVRLKWNEERSLSSCCEYSPSLGTESFNRLCALSPNPDHALAT